MTRLSYNEVMDYARSIAYSECDKIATTDGRRELEVVIDGKLVPGELSFEKKDDQSGEIRVTVHIFRPKFFGILSSKARFFSIFPDGSIRP